MLTFQNYINDLIENNHALGFLAQGKQTQGNAIPFVFLCYVDWLVKNIVTGKSDAKDYTLSALLIQLRIASNYCLEENLVSLDESKLEQGINPVSNLFEKEAESFKKSFSQWLTLLDQAATLYNRSVNEFNATSTYPYNYIIPSRILIAVTSLCCTIIDKPDLTYKEGITPFEDGLGLMSPVDTYLWENMVNARYGETPKDNEPYAHSIPESKQGVEDALDLNEVSKTLRNNLFNRR